MRFNRLGLLLAGSVVLAACGNSDATSPIDSNLPTADAIDLVPDYATSSATVIDGAGIGGAKFPDSLALTVEQKAAIEALHASFMTSTASDKVAIEAIEVEARAARDAGKSREEVKLIIQKAIVIRQRMDLAFKNLREAIFAIYTPAQRAWVRANDAKECSANGGPALTEAQLAQIKSIKHAFEVANRADIMTIRTVASEAKAAREAGKSEAELMVILEKAKLARDRVRAAEKKLFADIMAVLTPAQRAGWCVGRGMRGAGGPVGNG